MPRDEAIDALQAQLAGLHQRLHDLCQPLTALQCWLEIGRMHGDAANLREAIDGGLTETRRMFATVALTRSWLNGEEAVLEGCRSQQAGVQRADGTVGEGGSR